MYYLNILSCLKVEKNISGFTVISKVVDFLRNIVFGLISL